MFYRRGEGGVTLSGGEILMQPLFAKEILRLCQRDGINTAIESSAFGKWEDLSEIIKLCNEINKKEGEGSVYSIGSKHANLKIDRWSTGIEDLDSIIGGGMPEGRVIEIFGPEGSGKTTLLYHLCARHQLCLDIPVEGTFDIQRAKVFGNKAKQMLVYRAKYGEQAMNKTIEFAKLGIPLIGIDSVPSLVPKDDVDKIMKAAARDTEEELRIGGVARLLTKYLPAIEEIMEVTGTTLIFINQVRDKMIGGEAAIGVMFSGDAIYVIGENPDLDYVIPEEGTNVWIDGWVIPKNAPNKENAEKFIDFMCRPDVALKNFEYITYGTPNTAARELIEDEDLKNSPIAFPDLTQYNNLETFLYLGEDGEELYNKYWKEVMSN
jgi:RecA/RadA recombinase